MDERLKLLRKTLGLTQQEFADRLKIKRGAVANYEIGRNVPIDAVVSLICKEFNVREKWLRDGEGDMFPKKEPEPLEALLGQGEITDQDRSLVKVFLKLKPSARAEVIRFVEDCARELSSPAADQPSAVSDVASRLAELERQNQELMALVAEQREEIDQIKREDAADALLEAQPETVRHPE